MFDLAALPMPSLPVAAGGFALESAGNAAETGETRQSGGFEALLAIQISQPISLAKAQQPEAANPAPLPASGKILPDAAMPLAALTAALAVDDLAAASDAPFDQKDDNGEDTSAETALPGQLLPDQTMIAAILAAPRTLTATTPVERATSARINSVDASQSTVRAVAAKGAEATTAVLSATVAIARAAVIETDPPASQPVESEVAAQAAGVPQAAGAKAALANETSQRPARPLPGALSASEKTDTPSASAATLAAELADDTDTLAPVETADDFIAAVQARTAETAQRAEVPAGVRAEIRPERIDFATLVDTLNRAREEAEPNSVRVAIAHADFGRVSMRFDQDDKGMTIAMSSADPGFARAVSATNEAASTNTSADTPRDQATQSQSRNAGTAGDGARQQQQQQDARTPTAERPAAQLRDTLRRDADRDAPDGIFA